MARQNVTLYAMNRGEVSRLGLARGDVKRIALAAETQVNWMPRVLGSAMVRPGMKYITSTLSNAAAKYLKFIFSTTDLALLELTSGFMRVLISDTLLTRPAVTTAITNGTFASDISSWTDLSDAGGVPSWNAAGYLQLVGTGSARAISEQQVTTMNSGTEHGIRIVIARGPVVLRIGSSSGADDYVKETTLFTGTHSLSITPNGNFYIRFSSLKAQKVWVDSCTIESAGVVSLPTPWTDLSKVRIDQSGDVIFAAGGSAVQQRRIERRGTRPAARSWSVCLYAPEDGPFDIENVGPTTLTASAITGNITVTASLPLFKSTHVGGLFSITSVGQSVTATASASLSNTSSIRVTGIAADRTFAINITGDATGSTVNLQRSFDDAVWASVAGQTWTANVTTTYTDGLENQIVYYRLQLTTRVAPDSVTMALSISTGSVRGIVRVTDFTSSTSVGAEVLKNLGGTGATAVWQEGNWSDKNGWPTSVKIHEGRMCWAGQNGIWETVSDAYDSFDETVVGDSGPINRTIGSGPVDTINWLLSLKGLVVGAQGAEFTIRASSLDEVVTPTNFNLKASSTQGSGNVDAIKVDQSGYFVNRSGTKVFNVLFDLKAYDYNSVDMTEVNPSIGYPGIVRMDCQRLPDTRLHCVRSDGTAAVAVVSKAEDLLAWVRVTSNGASGLIEDVVVMPAADGALDDDVYYVVKRTIDGSAVRYLEKWAQEINCVGGQSNQMGDAHVVYSGVPTLVITGLSHLEGQLVTVWADGLDVGTDDSTTTWTQTYTVSGGTITLATAASNVVVGLPYTSQLKSSKLGNNLEGGMALNKQKKANHIGLILADSHPKGVRYGPDFDNLDDMPGIEAGTAVGTATVTSYDENMIEFPGTWTTDMRVCLQGQAPRPCTVLAFTMNAEVNS